MAPQITLCCVPPRCVPLCLQLPAGWEKRLNNAVKVMLHKKQLAHAAGHMGSFRLSKSMAEKEEKRLKRMAKVRQCWAVPG